MIEPLEPPASRPPPAPRAQGALPSSHVPPAPHGSRSRRLAGTVLLVAIAALFAGASPAHARQEAPAEELPEAREVTERYVEAIGGEEALRSHTSEHLVGEMELAGQGVGGVLEVFAMAPDKLLVRVEMGPLGTTLQGYDGEVGWMKSPAMGPMVLEDEMLDEIREEADFYSELHDPEDFTSMETVSRTTFRDRPAYEVELVRTSGRAYTEYYDVDSGLLLGRVGEQQSPMGSMRVTTTVSEWERAGGVRIPTRTVQRLPTGQEIVMTIQEIEYDSVDPAVFELPAEIRTLLESDESEQEPVTRRPGVDLPAPPR